MSTPDPAPHRRTTSRRDAPLWRQASEGIGLVVILSVAVVTGGLLLSLLVALLF